MGEYKSRSNDPRITKGAKKDSDLYQFAYEVALQPADTPERKRMKKDAQNYVRAFESRFQKEAFTLSGGRPYSAGGKGEFVDERFVDKNPANDNKKKTAALPKNAAKRGSMSGTGKPLAKALPKNAAKRGSRMASDNKPMPAGVKRGSKAGTGKPLAKAKPMPAGVKRGRMSGTGKPLAKKTGKK